MFRILTMVVMILSLLASGAAVSAQGTPAAGGSLLGDLGYPEITIVATESGFEVPDDVQAGTVLLTLENRAPFPMGFSLIQLPEGASLADLGPPPGAEAGASPAAGRRKEPGRNSHLFSMMRHGLVASLPSREHRRLRPSSRSPQVNGCL